MSKRVILGGLIALAAYAAYEWNKQRAAFPNGVPLGNIFRPTDPFSYAAIAAGAVIAYATKG